MKKAIIKFGILVAVFFVSLFGFGIFMNKTNIELTRDMADASLPLITIVDGEMEINELHGYTTEMNEIYVRDSITPVSSENTISLHIATDAKVIESIRYEIRSLDTETLYVEQEITDFTQEKGAIYTDLPIQSIIDEGVEYNLAIILSDGTDEYYYYTRLIKPVNCYVEETLEFAMNFHDTALNPDTYSTLSTYVEPNSSADNSTLAYVDIHSTLKQIGYASLEPEELVKPTPKVVEITSSYNVIVLDYVLTTQKEDGTLEYYNVEEYFRIRHTSTRDYLLDYERTMSQIVRGDNITISGTEIDLGICDEDINYIANESGTVVAFVQEGELWSYNVSSNSLYQVFSFQSNEGIESRENYNQHDIKIATIDEAGNMTFVVFGYMNRGDHEGMVGVGVYYFDATANTIEEQAFIPTDISYQVLQADVGDLLYESTEGVFYIMMENVVYAIDLETKEVTELVSDLEEGSYAVSSSNRYFAYISAGEENASTEITLWDLEEGTTQVISATDGTYVKPLAFIEEDFIYGIANSSDVLTDAAGVVTFAMKKVLIVSADTLETQKEYEKSGYFVESVTVENYTIYLNRIQYNGSAYVTADQDTIMNREGDALEVVSIETSTDDTKERVVSIELGSEVSDSTTRLLTPKEIENEESNVVEIDLVDVSGKYYAYSAGKVVGASYNLADAIGAANETMGVVIGDDGGYLWKRARSTSVSAISLDTSVMTDSSTIVNAVSALLATKDISLDVSSLIANGSTPKEIMEGALKDVQFMDLTGCDVEEILYYISCGVPVFAMSGNDTAVVIVGYDSTNLIIYDTALQMTYTQTQEEAQTTFENYGSVFFTYLE